MHVGQRGAVLPEGLELMPPGPELFALLASMDRAALSDKDRVRLLRARHRVSSHLQAELCADLYAVSLEDQPDDDALAHGAPSRYPWAASEVAFALRWTETAAGARLEQARQLVEDMPRLLAALHAGLVDMPKVLVICELAGWLADRGTARRLVDAILDQAPDLTTGQIRAKLRRLVLAVDPDAARRRCTRALKSRRVESFPNPDGTGEVWGRNLPPQDAAAAWERLTAVARAARAAGDDRTMDQLRADALLDLLVGEGIAVGQQVTRHLAGLPGADGRPDDSVGDDSARDDSARDDSAATPPTGPGPWVDDPAVIAAGGDPGPTASPASRDARPTASPAGGSPAVPAGALPAPRRGTVELLLPLTTATGQDDLPGELAGWGPVLADIARHIAAQRHDDQWRFSAYGRLGDLVHHGTITTRPTGPATPRRTRRRPTANVTRFVKARNRTCTAPGCRIPAGTCDLDHTTDWAHGGESEPDNLGPTCRRHHRFKHESGATLWQLDPGGAFVWTTRRGMQYVTRPEAPVLGRHPRPGQAPP